MLSFQFEDLIHAYGSCLERFSNNIIITASLHTIRELYLSGQNEYNKDSKCLMGIHNALGFRILAANILAAMIKSTIEEKCQTKIFRHNVKCGFDGVYPEQEKVDSLISQSEKRLELIKASEPALKKWSEVFKIPFSIEVNLNVLYYTNNNIDNE